MINIAIDGPAGAGKSTLARSLAKRLGFLYVDTGALYRAVGLFVLRAGARPDDAAAVAALLPRIAVRLEHGGNGQRVLLCGEDVTEQIRTPEISMAASAVSAIPAVRAFLLELQRSIARENHVIMDGRDIGTVVLPDAQLKIFLTASPEDRARRRFEEMRAKGMDARYEDVLEDVVRRDRQDTSRKIAPLAAAPDAVTVVTTGFEFSRSLETLCRLCRERLRPNGGEEKL